MVRIWSPHGSPVCRRHACCLARSTSGKFAAIRTCGRLTFWHLCGGQAQTRDFGKMMMPVCASRNLPKHDTGSYTRTEMGCNMFADACTCVPAGLMELVDLLHRAHKDSSWVCCLGKHFLQYSMRSHQQTQLSNGPIDRSAASLRHMGISSLPTESMHNSTVSIVDWWSESRHACMVVLHSGSL